MVLHLEGLHRHEDEVVGQDGDGDEVPETRERASAIVRYSLGYICYSLL